MPKTKQATEQAARLKIYTPQLDVLEERLLEWIEQDKYQAMVIKATRFGVPIFEGCYGTSTNGSGVKLDTIFPVFSDTKPVLAVLIMILLDEGRLELKDNLYNFIPEYHTDNRWGITLANLLTHTSGVDEEFFKSVENYIKDELKIERPERGSPEKNWDKYNSDLKKAMELTEDVSDGKVWEAVSLRVNMNHWPGQYMYYGNYSYDRLRDVICVITGESIDSYAKRVLFEPLGMVDSYWILPKEKYSRVLGRNERCTGYDWINSERCFSNEGGGNGLKTTVDDMTRFCGMILGRGRYNDKRILSPASIREMTSDYNSQLSSANPWDAWGLGWNYRGTKVDDAGILRSPNSVEHGGWAGHKCMVDPERGISVTIFTAEYRENSFGDFGAINNMIIAACE